MSNRKLKPVIISCYDGTRYYKQTVFGKQIRFAFLPGVLFVMHPGMYGSFTLTHAASGHAVALDKDYGECLKEAIQNLEALIKKHSFQKLARKRTRHFINHFKTLNHEYSI